MAMKIGKKPMKVAMVSRDGQPMPTQTMNSGVQAIFEAAEAQQRGKAHAEQGSQRKARQRVAHGGHRLLPDHGKIVRERDEDIRRRRQDHLGIAEDHDQRLPRQQQSGGEGRR